MAGVVRPIISVAYKHIKRMLSCSSYRRFNFLALKFWRKKRFETFDLKVDGMQLRIPDYMSFLYQYEEIFVNKSYEFPKIEKPRILDIGSNIGLSVLFFKRYYPDAIIDAFEPDPNVFSCLEFNVETNNLTDVKLHNKAAWIDNGHIQFSSSGADAGHISKENNGDNVIEIESIDLRDFLKGKYYDFVKMDIEGAEVDVLPHCADLLLNTRFLFLEYHERPGEKQQLVKLLNTLENAGFRITIHQVFSSESPFMAPLSRDSFCMQLNIFAYKEKFKDSPAE